MNLIHGTCENAFRHLIVIVRMTCLKGKQKSYPFFSGARIDTNALHISIMSCNKMTHILRNARQFVEAIFGSKQESSHMGNFVYNK